MSVIVGMIAGRGVNGDVIPVVNKYLESQAIQRIFIAVGPNKENDSSITSNHRVYMVNWEGPDDHSHLAFMRNRMMELMDSEYPADWYCNVDDDGLPLGNYLETLDSLRYDYPVILTGKLQNANCQRHWDLGYSDGQNFPFLLPYDNWNSEQFKSCIYLNGNQHILNRAAFNLGVKYRPFSNEDTWFARDVRDAGATIEFCPDMVMRLMRFHPPVGPGPYYDGIS